MFQRRPIHLAAARSALHALMEHPEHTEKVSEIVEALAGRQPERLLRRLRRDPCGARLFGERPHFEPSPCDLESLLALPLGTFGRSYAEWMHEHHFTSAWMEHRVATDDPDVTYVAQRLNEVHDLWHVLSGYDSDPVGELGVLTFGWGQTHSRGIGLILATVLWRDLRAHWEAGQLSSPLVPYLWRAWRASRRARFLAPVILEDFFELPLCLVRKLLQIEPLDSGIDSGYLAPSTAPSRAVS